VTEWPSIAGVDDRQLAESLRLSGVNALTKVYDAYAARLYDYCHALLNDQDDAAEVVHDTMIAAKRHAGKLRDPERFRGWLYAIARNLCVRLRNDPDRSTPSQPAPEPDENGNFDAKQRAQRKETKLVVNSALAVLTVAQREAVDLTMRHELDPGEMARVLGLNEADASGLVEEARRNLADALSATLTARAVAKDCQEATALVGDWPLAADECKKLIKHVKSCNTCGEQHDGKAPMRALMQSLPVAKIPTKVRTRVHTTATAPEHHRDRMTIARRAEPFDRDGWPVFAEAAGTAKARGPRRRFWPAVAAATCGTVVVALMVACLPQLAGRSGPADNPRAGGPGLPSEAPSEVPESSADPSPPSPSLSPSPTPSNKSAKPSSPSPTRADRRRPTATPREPSLTVAGCHMDFAEYDCPIRLTAGGTSVHWEVTGASGSLQASGSGTLAAGRSTTVTVARRGLVCLGSGEGSVSVSPGGVATVTWC
jgi:RNA polymerase sigma factor (sigma-70 family)